MQAFVRNTDWYHNITVKNIATYPTPTHSFIAGWDTTNEEDSFVQQENYNQELDTPDYWEQIMSNYINLMSLLIFKQVKNVDYILSNFHKWDFKKYYESDRKSVSVLIKGNSQASTLLLNSELLQSLQDTDSATVNIQLSNNGKAVPTIVDQSIISLTKYWIRLTTFNHPDNIKIWGLKAGGTDLKNEFEITVNDKIVVVTVTADDTFFSLETALK